jgi:hypothetical protein
VAIHLTTDNAALGALRLPWCVDRATMTEPIQISDERHRIPEAVQLRVQDVGNECVKQALRKQESKGEPSLTKIEAIMAAGRKTGHMPAIEDSEGFWIEDELSLMEGCHRTCALYLLDPSAIELRTLIRPPVWDAYFNPGLVVSPL